MARDERPYRDLESGIFAVHLARYVWALPYAYGRRVLDAGCGAGYGADLLAVAASEVVAVDYDPEAVAEDSARYEHRPNLEFEVMDVAHLAFPDAVFDLVVSFEVYEHLEADKAEAFLREAGRVLRLGGRLLLSTPNRLVEAPYLKGAGLVNELHVNPVSPVELPRFRGHPIVGEEGVHDAEEPSTVPARVSGAAH